jgi:methionyl-tRNA formyltransferase
MKQRIVILTTSEFIATQLEDLRVVVDLKELNPETEETIIMVSYPKLIRTADYPKYRFLNVHNSLLPKYRGLHAFTWAICNGEKETGFTLHHVNDKIDAGNIIDQLRIEIQAQEDINQLFEKAWVLFFPWFRAQLQQLEWSGIPSGIEQDESQASYFKRRTAGDSRIHWDDTAENIHNLIRAVCPPYTAGAYFELMGQKIHVRRSSVINDVFHEQKAGFLMTHDNTWVVICGSGALQLVELTMEEMDTRALLKENTLLI